MDKVYYQYRDSLMNSHRIMDETGAELAGDSLGMGVIRKEVDLTNEEKQYLLAVERGDIPSTRQYLALIGHCSSLNINCVDPLGRTALLIAIENENIEMIELLLSYNIEVGDALLHAINEENVEAVELILNHEVQQKGEEDSVNEYKVLHQSVPSSSFTPDITPIILAAHRDNYEIIKILLDRGFRIPKPHDVRCNCKNCVTQSSEDSLRHSRSRINAYRALASPSLIALSSKDPILTSFELSWELKRLSKLENEFKVDYEKLAKKCQEFAVDLLEQTRGSKELEVILNHDASCPGNEQEIPTTDNRMKLSRLKLAIKYKQKKFVAHPNCQQLLATLWYEGCPGFRRRNIVCKLLITVTIGFMFPLLSLTYLLAPKSSFGKLIRKPFLKFICHSSSYVTFLLLLIMVSQRVEIPMIDNDTMSFVKETKTELRGAPATTIEWMILAYVAGLIWIEIKQLWDEGAEEYVHDMWNILDFVTNSLYIATLTLRVIAYLQVQKEKELGLFERVNLERRNWDPYDPNLIAEALFAAANIFSSLKLIYIFTVNPHLGPLQISLGRMILDLMKFAMLYTLLLFCFSCGLNHLHWYYATLRSEECNMKKEGQAEGNFVNKYDFDPCDRRFKSFANLFEIIQSLYWAIYGLVDLDHLELEEPHEFTEFIGKLMFGTYSWIGFVILLNLLIAMMSNSYQNISSQADEEWKFARSRLWISYFDESGTLPAPFNIIPSPKTFYYILRWFQHKLCVCSKDRKRNRWQSIRKVVKKINEREIRYQAVMRDLIKRYVMAKQRSPQRGEGVTEDDVNELKQDISSFRYELLEILRNNGMKTPNLNAAKPSNRRLSRRKNQRRSLERLKKSFTMGNLVEAVSTDQQQSSASKDLLGAFRPTPVTDGCSSDIPETIIEEHEGSNAIDKRKRILSSVKKIETFAEVVQSSTESNNSNSSHVSEDVRTDLQSAANARLAESHRVLVNSESDPICESPIISSRRNSPILGNKVNSQVHAGSPASRYKVTRETNGQEVAVSSNGPDPDGQAQNCVANSVMTNSKGKQSSQQTDDIERAIGYFLESKSRNTTSKVVKRVKFN